MIAKTKRATVYLEADIHKALRLKAAAVEASMSDIVNDALRAAFAEDAADLTDIRDRVNEPSVSFETFVTRLKERGEL